MLAFCPPIKPVVIVDVRRVAMIFQWEQFRTFEKFAQPIIDLLRSVRKERRAIYPFLSGFTGKAVDRLLHH